eukprot:Blabericola_migrator_1__5808@NODE_2941_length_2187_cov_113_757075_g1844_i0_p2_GENE_NODE_2941_length_2187_cov_113_757075_g1844_i0NODE_2941_length_2187_cov_113_757075_g1844_i0_p2_ORF_typecomplete_len254_score40_20SNARE_assoc/PF09335_11/1_9e07SNARE_assoc/PF09335_11/1_7e03_NODE_2941_length_2187_cov_113_757075_g1844_i08821643
MLQAMLLQRARKLRVLTLWILAFWIFSGVVTVSETSGWFGKAKYLIVFGMFKFIERYGSPSVFLLSCWPNALFDLCGILCGQFLMPFWEFFIPLVLGKAVVKVFIQTSFTIYVFSKIFDESRAKTIAYLVEIPPFSHIVAYRFGSSAEFESWVLDQIRRLRKGPQHYGPRSWTHYVKPTALFSYAVYAVLIFFVIGLVEQTARSQQKMVDDLEWQAKWRTRLEEDEDDDESTEGQVMEDTSLVSTSAPMMPTN